MRLPDCFQLIRCSFHFRSAVKADVTGIHKQRVLRNSRARDNENLCRRGMIGEKEAERGRGWKMLTFRLDTFYLNFQLISLERNISARVFLMAAELPWCWRLIKLQLPSKGGNQVPN